MVIKFEILIKFYIIKLIEWVSKARIMNFCNIFSILTYCAKERKSTISKLKKSVRLSYVVTQKKTFLLMNT